MSSRLNQKQVDKQISEERNKFYHGVYNGDIAIPENIQEVFSKAIFSGVLPQDHQIHVSSLRRMTTKPLNELTNVEIGSMINVILTTVFDKIYPDMETALTSHEHIEKFVMYYNEVVNKFNEALDKKRMALMQIIQPNGNGMRIIANA
jgi:hypothetical protein